MDKQKVIDGFKDKWTKFKILVGKVVAVIVKKIKESKDKLDDDTRQKLRIFWIAVAIATFAIGFKLGTLS